MMSLFPRLCFVLISFSVALVSAQTCMNKGYFSSNGTYNANRRLILSFLPSNVTAQDAFFYNGSIGQEPNRVYARGMCIPGSTSYDCYHCIKTASGGLIQSCPNQTDAYWWRVEPTLCHVRYSNSSFSGSADLNPRVVLTNIGDLTSNLTEFTKIWEHLVARVIVVASTPKNIPFSSNNYYTANIESFEAFQNIYAVMQCTPDLSSGDCESCLRQNARDYQSCCSQKKGGLVMQPSCFFRWDLYTFSKAFPVASPPPMSIRSLPPPPGDSANTNDNNSKGISAGIVVAITVPTVVVVFMLVALGFVLCLKRPSLQILEHESDSDVSTTNSLQFQYKTVEAATNKFSVNNKLGEGRFGDVYKGKFPNGTEVAVKRLYEMSGKDTRKFRNEVVLVSKLQHKNLVRLLGFCLQGEEKILIYEFLPNKSLDYYLFDPEKQGQLDWTRRNKIIGEIAQGILHLHSHLTVIYREFKASNILLDDDMNPKISDLGMATIFGMEETRGNTKWNAETLVYMSPEFAMHGKFSMKTDVYSFGILILEIISGKKNSCLYHMDENTTAGNLVTYVWRLWRNGSQLELVDPAMGGNYKSNEVTRCIHIALLCVQENPEDRPMLSTIITMLTSNTTILPVPRLPGFFPQIRHN
ncbi:cysteine-rich receptor-like protein kinase 11 isoform X1 [Brassica rapa]|uniref:cysteine-rich receptor-like protein kinase 11 isoform X1 n=1 Tax=Brassica campestris TaxID=3711 RepID=UPI0004F147F9|nr:cysteine-rich receptor-like protein kinase 11 isoform X1 [Brassica rapa]